MFIRSLLTGVLYGVGGALGSLIVAKGVEVFGDPHKRSVVKQNVKSIKDAFIKKNKS
jgi:hypothetical protein